MAMTGGTAYLVKSEKTNYGSNSWTTDLYIYVKVISQNVIANCSTIALGMYVYSKYSIAWSDFGTNGTSYIGTATSGSNCFTFTNGQSGSGTKWLIEDKQVTVYHNSNGTLTLPIYWHWGVNSPWGQYTGPSGSYNVTLSTIDRAAPTVTFSVSAITANGFKISANSTSTADIWQYSTNGGSSWTQFSTTASTSASVTITSLSPNTSYTVRVRARRQYNHVYGTSGSSTVKTLGGAVVNSVNTVTADNATVSITINVTVYEASYTNTLVLKNGSTTILTISGLSWSKGTANRTVTLTSAQRTTLLNAMASIKSFTGTFAVSSYSGSTHIGSTSSKTAPVLTTATNSAPTISGFTYADSYTTTKNLTGNDQLFIQNYSILKVTPGTATAKNGASISNYTASCNGLSSSNTTGSALSVGKIAKSGSVTVTLTVTDSRGYTASVFQTITVIPYAKPKVSSVTLRRTNDIEAEMQLKFSGSISAVTVDMVVLPPCSDPHRVACIR
jgi:ribosomal protein L11